MTRVSASDVGVVLAALGVVALLGGCTAKPAPEVAPLHVVEAGAPAAAPADASAATTSDAAGTMAPDAAATTSVVAGTQEKASHGTSADASRASPTHAAPTRAATKVVTIGMHVGGGPYDEPTKEPMKRSVEPRFPELAQCWTHVTSAPKPADAGVDLVIEAGGGRARVSNPRTQVQGEGFVRCVVAFFEGIDFEKPRNGKTVVSYSVRFSP